MLKLHISAQQYLDSTETAIRKASSKYIATSSFVVPYLHIVRAFEPTVVRFSKLLLSPF
jgi:hypothetical protein